MGVRPEPALLQHPEVPYSMGRSANIRLDKKGPGFDKQSSLLVRSVSDARKVYNPDASVYAASLIEMGESMKQIADLKYALDDNVKQVAMPSNFFPSSRIVDIAKVLWGNRRQ